MKSSEARLARLGAVFGGAAVVVLGYLWYLMGVQHEQWLVLGYRNRWTFRDVPTHRGAITDRHGAVLVHDVPTFSLAVDYHTFRRTHPVGAAVHGASLLAEHEPRLQGARFAYGRGPLGAEVACAEMLALPLAWLRPGGPEPRLAQNLRFYAVALLAGCSGRRSQWVGRAITDALARGAGGAVGDCLPGIPREQLLAAFAQSLGELDALDYALQGGHGKGCLLASLDELRASWFDLPEAERGQRRIEQVADRLPFDTAAALRTGALGHPGLRLQPSVRRERVVPGDDDSLLDTVLGTVVAWKQAWDPDSQDARQRFSGSLERVLPADEVDELVPEDAGPEAVRSLFQDAARDWVAAMLRENGRLGRSGVEKAADAVLAGTPGLRLVERDKRAREQQMLSYPLQVDPGADVALSLDLELQQVVEAAAAAEYQLRLDAETRPAARQRVAVGIALVDALSGEVLAVGGQPLRLEGRPVAYPPGLNWYGPGDIGSAVKPFVQLEHFAAEREGRPHSAPGDFRACSRHFGRAGGIVLECDGSHGERGRDPVAALAESCNFWFFQAARGLGADGVHRACRRFGLMPPDAAAPEFPAATWQPRPIGVDQASRPRVDPTHLLELRGIGYGVQASPVMVARAYAALATGQLLPATFLHGRPVDGVPLAVPAADLEMVAAGLRECVESGTASKAKSASVLQELGVVGKTGTAEITKAGDNNALFAGFLPWRGQGGVVLAFCAAVYFVPDGEHGGKVAAEFLAHVLQAMHQHDTLRQRYLQREGGR